MTSVCLDFRNSKPVVLTMTEIPRVGDFVNDEVVESVQWTIDQDRYNQDPLPTTYSVFVTFEEA